MKKRAFTLIELIAVLVMIGLLIAVVVPTVSNLMKNQDKKKYEMYYDLVNHSVDLYAETRRDDLGGVENEGCINDFTVGDLIEEEYMKFVDTDSGRKCANKEVFNGGVAARNCIVCGSPADFPVVYLRSMGYVDTGYESKIRISNNEGFISKEVPMICVKNDKIVYEKKYKSSACNKFVAESVATVSLLNEISSKVSSTHYQNNDYFVSGSATNNYVWYSGKLWRIISYNKVTGLIKMVTEDAISTITYDIVDDANRDFKDTNVGIWLNTTFYSSLRTPSRFIEDQDVNFSVISNPNILPTTNINKVKVGLLNLFEYNKINGFLNINQKWWLSSKASTGEAWSIYDTNVSRAQNNKTFFGVRPSIVLKPNITFNKGGTGTVNNPYVLKGEGRIVSGVLLKDRFPGEYVVLKKGNDSYTFRISSITNDYVRLVLDFPLNVENIQFHYDDKFYSSSNYIGEYLKVWKTGFNLVDADFCRMTTNTSTSITSVCQRKDIINIDIAIPRLGDMFTTSSNKEYWTINNFDGSTINVVKPDGTVSSKGILDNSGIRPVINLSSTVRVSGAGTKAQPFTLTQ